MPYVVLAYNRNDFYYATSNYYNNMLSSNVCSTNYLADETKETYWNNQCCTNSTDKTNCATWDVVKCSEFELCKNKQNADLANDLENKNRGTEERQRNLENQYQKEIVKTINLSASILLITYFSTYFFNP